MQTTTTTTTTSTTAATTTKTIGWRYLSRPANTRTQLGAALADALKKTTAVIVLLLCASLSLFAQSQPLDFATFASVTDTFAVSAELEVTVHTRGHTRAAIISPNCDCDAYVFVTMDDMDYMEVMLIQGGEKETVQMWFSDYADNPAVIWRKALLYAAKIH